MADLSLGSSSSSSTSIQEHTYPESASVPALGNGVPMSSLKRLSSGAGSSNNVDNHVSDPDDDISVLTNEDELDYNSDESYGADSDYDFTINYEDHFDMVDLPPGVEASVSFMEQPSSSKKNRSTISNQSGNGKDDDDQDETVKKFKLFKQFDVVDDSSDHHFQNNVSTSKKASQDWTRKIQNDWKLLENDLPDTILVRVYEERMDLLRAVIIGAASTPYHDGLFFFDVFFPLEYPGVPPNVHYHSCGHRINPNLYNSGKVCLSLLGTWSGNGIEKWNPKESTMLQVLLSIQALVLNEKPYFNEPGYERSIGTPAAEKISLAYSENVFILSCRTMVSMLNKPPKHFEDFVVGHFRERAFPILKACKAYIEGTMVGTLIEEVENVDIGDEKEVAKADKEQVDDCANFHSNPFAKNVGTMVACLVPRFIQIGAKNCEQFIYLGDVNRPIIKKQKTENTQI